MNTINQTEIVKRIIELIKTYYDIPSVTELVSRIALDAAKVILERLSGFMNGEAYAGRVAHVI